MITTKKFRASLLLRTMAVVGFLALVWPGQGEVAEAADNSSQALKGEALEEIVVTARKRTENLQEVPVSVSAISGEQLKEQSIKTISNLQNVVPGLFVQQAIDADPNSLVFTMRGRKQDDATLAVDAAVGINVDGLSIPRTIGMAGSMLDIDRVEVLRGPQGTLYGRNTTGGAIGIFTKDPTHDLSGSIDVTGGNFGTWNAVGIVNVPIADNLDARVVAQSGGNGGYAHTTSGTPLNDSHSDYFRGKLRWSGSDNWQAVLSAHYEHDRSGGPRIFVPGLNPANYQGNGLPEGSYLTLETMADLGLSAAQAVALEKSWIAQRSPWYTLDNTHGPAFISDIKRWDAGLTISGDVTDHVQFRSITGVQDLRRNAEGGPQFPIYIFATTHDNSSKYYSQELQLSGTSSDVKWTVGAYGGYETGSDSGFIFFMPAAFASTAGTANDNGIRNTTLAGYAQATWEFVPTWHLTAGARYTSDTRRVDAGSFTIDLVDPTIHICAVPAPGADSTLTGPSQCPRRFDATFTRPTWLVSLDHQLTPDVLLYAKAATGYRSGGLNADTGYVDLATFRAFAPETNIEYETGVKSEFLDHRVRLNAAVYWDDYKNLQVQTIVLGANQSFQTAETNAATARIRGIEIEGDFIVGGGLRLHTSTAYTDARYVSFPDTDQATGLPIDRSHQPFSVPKWTFSLGPNYTHPTGVGDVSFELDYDWKSAVNAVPATAFADQVTQPGYGLLNARANLHLDAWNMDVALFGQNLTNKEYFDQGYNFAIPGAGFDFSQLFLGGAPRIYGVEFVKKFGK